MAIRVTQGWIDNDSERAHSSFHLPDLGVAYDELALGADALAVRLAMDTLTLMNETKQTAVLTLHTATPTPPSSVLAQREAGVRFFYADTVTGKIYRMDLPGVDRTTYGTPGSVILDLTETDVATFVSAFNDKVKSEVGNAVEIQRGVWYGKNT
jgi:hypothetical protein